MYLAMTGDMTSLPRMRREVASKDVVASSWTATGRALRAAMDDQSKTHSRG